MFREDKSNNFQHPSTSNELNHRLAGPSQPDETELRPDATMDPLADQPQPGMTVDDQAVQTPPAAPEPPSTAESAPGTSTSIETALPEGQRPAEIPPAETPPPEPPAAEPAAEEPAPEPAPEPAQPPTAMERSRALWKELEPTDPTDPVDHLAKHFIRLNGFLAIAASRRGRSHAHDAKYREDAFKLGHVRQWVILAVADGAGSKPLSRIGARLACDTAVEYLKNKLAYNPVESQELKIYLRSALSGALAHALAEIVTEASRREKDANDFACTLLLAAYSTDKALPVLGVAQIGDGGIAAQSQDGSCGQLSTADRGAFAGEALFITSQDAQLTWASRARVYQLSIPVKALLLATDGVMDDFIEPLGKLDDLFSAMEGVMQARHPDEALLDWMNYERRGSFDDRTVVMLYPYDGGQGTA